MGELAIRDRTEAPRRLEAPLSWAPGRARSFSLLAALCFLGAAHIWLGANPVTVGIAMMTVLLGVWAVARYGFLNLGALLIFAVTLRYVGFPLVGKLAMGQPLDSNLTQPLASFAVVFVGTVGYVLAMQVAEKARVGQPILGPILVPARLRFISVGAAVIGLAANFSVALHVTQLNVGTTVAPFLAPLLNLALIAAVAASAEDSEGRRGWDTWVVLLVLLELLFALVQNSRMAAVDTFLCYTLALAAFRGRIRFRQVVGFAAVAVIVVFFLTPVMLSVRIHRESMPWTDRVKVTLDTAVHWRESWAEYTAGQNSQQTSSFLLYYGKPQNALERMSYVEHVDALKTGADTRGTVGLKDIELAIRSVPPRVFGSDKLGYGQGDWLYGQVGLPHLVGGYATAPLIGNGYAAFGWIGAFVYPLLLGLLILMMLKKVCGLTMLGSIWAVYFLIRVHNAFVEGSGDAFLVTALRFIPQDFVILLVLAGLSATPALVRRKSFQ